MPLIHLLLIVALTAGVCGLVGASSLTTVLVTLVVSLGTLMLINMLRPNPWKPIENLKRHIANDHKRMVEAKRQAVDSLPRFWSLCADGVPLDAKVCVQLTDRGGQREELWMFLLDLPDAEGRVHVHLFNMPQLVDYDFNDTGDIDFHVHTNQLVDWSLEQSDGVIRGAFTTFALFELFEEHIGPLPVRTEALRKQFLDARTMNHTA